MCFGSQRVATASYHEHASPQPFGDHSSCRGVPATQADGVTPCSRVGIMYNVWHWPAYTASQIISASGK